MNDSSEKSTLLYHTGALGDFLTILPAIRYWKKNDPSSTIHLIGKPEHGILARDFGIVNTIIPMNSRLVLQLFNNSYTIEIKSFLKQFTKAILFTSPDSPIVSHCINSGLTVYHQSPFPVDRINIVYYHLSLFTDIMSESIDFPFIPSEKSQSEIKSRYDTISNLVVIHPGSGSPKKNWPLNSFLTIATTFRNKGYKIFWISGPVEKEQPYGELPDEDELINNLSLSTLAALLHTCAFYVGNDSGITHLASLVGCPTVAIFGPSDPTIWAHKRQNVRIAYNDTRCAPCHQLHTANPCDRKCLVSITPDQVMKEISSLITLH